MIELLGREVFLCRATLGNARLRLQLSLTIMDGTGSTPWNLTEQQQMGGPETLKC